MAALVLRGTPVSALLSRPLIRLGALAAFAALFVAGEVRVWWKVRRNRRELQRLSDHMLSDLDLNRSDIELICMCIEAGQIIPAIGRESEPCPRRDGMLL